jgi:hypothetical protein
MHRKLESRTQDGCGRRFGEFLFFFLQVHVRYASKTIFPLKSTCDSHWLYHTRHGFDHKLNMGPRRSNSPDHRQILEIDWRGYIHDMMHLLEGCHTKLHSRWSTTTSTFNCKARWRVPALTMYCDIHDVQRHSQYFTFSRFFVFKGSIRTATFYL